MQRNPWRKRGERQNIMRPDPNHTCHEQSQHRGEKQGMISMRFHIQTCR